MDRRQFITGTAAALAAAGILTRTSTATAAELDTLKVDLNDTGTAGAYFRRIKLEFLLSPGLTHLNCGSLGATPRVVLDAVTGYVRELEADPVNQLFGAMGAAAEEVRRRAAAFIGADTGEVAITRNTTEGMNLIASGLTLAPGDEVLTTNHEHGGGLSGWQHRAERDGVKLVQIKLPAAVPDKQGVLDLLTAAITPRTKVCCVSDVTTVTGLRMPLKDIAAITQPRGILLVVDGAQTPGMLAVDVAGLNVDAYVSSSHKWLLAPKGSGLLYIRKAVQDRIAPAGLRGGLNVYTAATGTRNVPHILGHGMAIDFHNLLGRERVEQRCRELCARLRKHLSDMPSVTILTPDAPELSGGILTFSLKKGSNDALAQRLFDERKIVVKVVPPTLIVDRSIPAEDYNAIRVSTHIFNDEADVDRLAEALHEMTQ